MKVDFVELSALRILALEVSEGCRGGNGLRYLAGTIFLQTVWQFTAVGQTAFSYCRRSLPVR